MTNENRWFMVRAWQAEEKARAMAKRIFCENLEGVSIIHLESNEWDGKPCQRYTICGYNMEATDQPKYADVRPCRRCFPLPDPERATAIR